jgi:hypothetical protein
VQAVVRAERKLKAPLPTTSENQRNLPSSTVEARRGMKEAPSLNKRPIECTWQTGGARRSHKKHWKSVQMDRKCEEIRSKNRQRRMSTTAYVITRLKRPFLQGTKVMNVLYCTRRTWWTSCTRQGTVRKGSARVLQEYRRHFAWRKAWTRTVWTLQTRSKRPMNSACKWCEYCMPQDRER